MDGREYIATKMPMIGMGTYQVNEAKIYESLDAGLACGYRLIDTAQLYGTEQVVGEALDELLPKHKLKRSLDDLQTDYLDLLLIHWPGVCKMPGTYPFNPILRHESYSVLEKFYDRGDIRAIGVSNFDERHLSLLLKECRIPPAVNQIEYHPHFHQTDLLDYCAKNGIHSQAYSSLGNEEYHEELATDPDVIQLASKYSVSVPVFLLAWSLSQGISVVPRSTNPDHIRENMKAVEVKISKEDIDRLLNNGKMRKVCWDSSYII